MLAAAWEDRRHAMLVTDTGRDDISPATRHACHVTDTGPDDISPVTDSRPHLTSRRIWLDDPGD